MPSAFVVLGTLLCAAAAAAGAGVQDVAGGDVAALTRALREEHTMAVLFLYDATHPAGVLNYKMLKEQEASLSIYADLYAVDVSAPASRYLARAYNFKPEQGFSSVIFAPTFATSADAKTATLARPGGGIKRPTGFDGPVSALKQIIQQKTPEPRALKKLTVKTPEELSTHLSPEGRTLVVFAESKDKVSAVLKSVALRLGGIVAKQLLVQINDKAAFNVEKLPSLALYEDGEQAVFEDKIERDALLAFFGAPSAEATLDAIAAKESADFKALKRKVNADVITVDSNDAFVAEVLDPNQGLVLLAFLDPDNNNDATLAVLKQMARAKTSLKGVVQLSTHKSFKLMEHFRVEPGSFVFVNAKHGKYVVFRGAQTEKVLTKFVQKDILTAQLRPLGNVPKYE